MEDSSSEEAGRAGGLTVEAVNGLLPEAPGDASVDAFILITLKLQKVLQQVQHLRHLATKKLVR